MKTFHLFCPEKYHKIQWLPCKSLKVSRHFVTLNVKSEQARKCWVKIFFPSLSNNWDQFYLGANDTMVKLIIFLILIRKIIPLNVVKTQSLKFQTPFSCYCSCDMAATCHLSWMFNQWLSVWKCARKRMRPILHILNQIYGTLSLHSSDWDSDSLTWKVQLFRLVQSKCRETILMAVAGDP